MSGEPDPVYVLARRALLDGLEALKPHIGSIVVVGAQAVYLTAGSADIAVAETTRDAGLALIPEILADVPLAKGLLEASGFTVGGGPGEWDTPHGTRVDLLVPEALAGPGRRAARLGPHGKGIARRVKGIEGVLIDNRPRVIDALEPSDHREFRVQVAGPAALIVAKTHKINERIASPDRLLAKDALDALRLLRTISTREISRGIRGLLAESVSSSTTEEALIAGSVLFGRPDGVGVQLVRQAVQDLDDPDVITASLVALWRDLTDEIDV